MSRIKGEKQNTKQVSFKIPVELYKEIKHSAIDRDLSIKDIFISAVKDYLSEDKIIIEPLDEEDMKIIERGRREIAKGEYEDMDLVFEELENES